MAIAPLDLKTAKLLTTAQVITSVSTAVKELVENALDAGASNIDIKLEDHGLSLFEVSDNGRGIAQIDTSFMALQSYTSKIKDFADLNALETYGFRGEALASLCSVADVTVITRTEEDEAARLYRMNHNGHIESSELSHRSVGTTVQARSMFKDIPVRRQIINNSKRANLDVKSLDTLLRSYAICHPRVRISYRVNGANIMTKPSTETMRESLTYLYGMKFISQVDFVDKNTPEVDVHLVIPARKCTELLEVCQVGQNVFVNKRPVSYKEIEKTIHQRLVEHFADKIPAKKKPGFFAILEVSRGEVDVNLEPNKTAVMLTNVAKIIQTLDKLLVEFYEIVEKSHETKVDEPTNGNDSTKEYHDYTSTEIEAGSDEIAPPSSKKRKLENRNDTLIGTDGSAVKNTAVAIRGQKIPNQRRRAMKLFESLADKENHNWNTKVEPTQETISQLPEVDLGEDFSEQEICKLLYQKLEQTEANPENSVNDYAESPTPIPEVTKIANGFTEEAWSKGQVPINLQGGTDVRIYNNALNDATSEIEEPESDTKTTCCKGFSKFSKEIRPQLIRENPGINLVDAAKMLTKLWKELSSEERGYYRDLEAADAVQRSNATSNCSNKSTRQKVSAEHAESNRKRFLNMLENMKNPKSEGSKNMLMRTVIPWTVNLETVTRSFLGKKSKASSTNAHIVLGGLNDNVWLARTGYQIWALSIPQLFAGMNLDNSDKKKNTRENVEDHVQRWLQNKDDLSLLHPVFELP